MKNKECFAVLFKKAIKDLKSNFKQFLSIIFIIAIAVTLFVGLQANYLSLKNRINEFYVDGNISSFWITYAVVDNDEKTNIDKLIPYEHEINNRLVIPAKIEGTNVNLAVADEYPTVSKANKLFVDGTSNEDLYHEVSESTLNKDDYFILDRALFTILYNDPGREDFAKKYKINDSYLDVSISISSYKSIILSFINEVFLSFDNSIENSELIANIINNYVNDYFEKNPYLNFKAQFSNYMLNPENLAADSTATHTALMSRNRFISYLSPLVDNIINGLKMELLDNNINSAYAISYYIKKYANSMYYSSNQLLLKLKNDADVPSTSRILNEYYSSKEYSENQVLNRMIYMTDLDNLVSNMTVQNDVEQANDLSIAIPILFLVVAVLIVITTISQLILKERTLIGSFKAIGLTKFEILSHYLMITLTLGIIGTVLGMILGPLILPKVMDIKYLILYSITPTTYTFPIFAAFITLIGILLIVGFITWFIVNKELKTTPAELMRPVSPKIKFKSKGSNVKETKFISLKIALRNIRVYFTKSIMVIIGILGCTGLLVCGYGIDDTLDYGIKHDLTTYFNYDIMATYTNYANDNTDEILNNPAISEYFLKDKTYRITTLPTSFYLDQGSSYTGSVYIIDKKSINDEIFKIDFPMNTIAISKTYADKLSLKVGDNLLFKVLDTEYEREISLIYENFSMKSIFIHSEDSLNGNDFGVYSKNNVTMTYFNLKDNISEEKTNEIVEEIKSMNISVATCMSLQQTKNQIESYVSSVKLMTLAIKIFAILLAVVCLINLALLNFKERTREIATLKVLGFSTFEIARSLIYEVLILTIVGSLIGLLFGFPMEYLVLSINQNNYVSFIYYISPLTYIIGVVVSVATSLVVNIILSLFIRKVAMVESLKSVE